MPDTRECPLCGSAMQVRRTQHVLQVPGNPTPTTSITAEWVCPDCDYFEEVEEQT